MTKCGMKLITIIILKKESLTLCKYQPTEKKQKDDDIKTAYEMLDSKDINELYFFTNCIICIR